MPDQQNMWAIVAWNSNAGGVVLDGDEGTVAMCADIGPDEVWYGTEIPDRPGVYRWTGSMKMIEPDDCEITGSWTILWSHPTDDESCTACGSKDWHTGEQCSERRPRCHVHKCVQPTCIQAMANNAPPTCLAHFFENERTHELHEALEKQREVTRHWEKRADEWRAQAQDLSEECERLYGQRIRAVDLERLAQDLRSRAQSCWDKAGEQARSSDAERISAMGDGYDSASELVCDLFKEKVDA